MIVKIFAIDYVCIVVMENIGVIKNKIMHIKKIELITIYIIILYYLSIKK